MKYESDNGQQQPEVEKEVSPYNSSDESNDEEFVKVESTIKVIFELKNDVQDEEKLEFNTKRANKMSKEEFLYFSECRSVQFQNEHKDKFIEFLALNEKSMDFIEKNKTITDFLSYLVTKAIGNIIENILRSHHNGKLEEIDKIITPEEAKAESNKSLEHVKFIMKKIIKDNAVNSLNLVENFRV